MILRAFTRGLFRTNRPGLRQVECAVCIDIECTCDSPQQIYPMELIEIACRKIELGKPETTHKEFHSFVRPVINPELTLFCTELTGIMQSTVDQADSTEKVMENWIDWMKRTGLIGDNLEMKTEFAFATCGNFDVKFLSSIINNIYYNNNLESPIYFKEWINVKKTFVNHKREWPRNLYHMMELLDIEPYGRLHSAKDDCRNLAKIVECLHSDGCPLFVTNKAT